MNNKKGLWEKVRKEIKGKIDPDVKGWIKDIDALRKQSKDIKISFSETLLNLRHGAK